MKLKTILSFTLVFFSIHSEVNAENEFACVPHIADESTKEIFFGGDHPPAAMLETRIKICKPICETYGKTSEGAVSLRGSVEGVACEYNLSCMCN